jgi:hypothetical protein
MFENLRMMDSAQNNGPVCCSTPASKIFRLNLKYLPIFAVRNKNFVYNLFAIPASLIHFVHINLN